MILLEQKFLGQLIKNYFKIKDQFFKELDKKVPKTVKNPFADIDLTLKHYSTFNIQNAYDGGGEFWSAQYPNSSDFIKFTFREPVFIKK